MGDLEGYDPEYVATEKALGFRPGLQGTLAEKKVQFNAILHGLAAQWPPIEGVDTREETINEHVKARIYTPKNIGDKKLPVCVFYHGGGWLSGDLDTEDPQCRMLVTDLPCVLISIEYRLAPENPMPTPIDDSLAGFEWAYANADKLGGDLKKYFVFGGSAGAQLSLAVTNRLVGSGRRSQVQGCIAINPPICHPDGVPEKYKNVYKSFEENGVGTPIVNGDDHWTAIKCSGSKPDNADTWVVLSPHLKDFPPTWISTNGKDVMRDDGVMMEQALKEAGVKVKRVHYEGMPHFFHVLPMMPKSRQMMKDAVDGVRFVLGEA